METGNDAFISLTSSRPQASRARRQPHEERIAEDEEQSFGMKFENYPEITTIRYGDVVH
jgi:hypothetical protein